MFINSIQPLLKLARITPRNGVITFGFVGGSDRVSTATQNRIRYVFKSMIEPFISVRFVETRGEGDINFQLHDQSEYAYAVGQDVFLSRRYDNSWTDNGFQSGFGSYGFETLLHETLHTMGLSHPGNYNGEEGGEAGPFLPYEIDNNTNSVMTYNNAGESAITPMPYDIEALQLLYGARRFNAGNTSYQFETVYSFNDGKRTWGNLRSPSKLTLWDQGGTDTLDFSQLRYEASGYFLDARAGGMITTNSELEAATYNPRDGANRNPTKQSTSTYGTRLTFKTRIETVIGSKSDDTIIGGENAQEIDGGSGQDTIFGNRQDDVILGGIGDDTVVGDRGRDRLYGGRGNDTLFGEDGHDKLFGQQHDDLLSGGEGNDRLAGSDRFFSKERDQLFGGAGRDRFVLGSKQGSFYRGSGYAIIKDWQAGLDKILLGRTDRKYSVRSEQLIGGEALDTAIYHGRDLIGVVEDSTNLQLSGRDFAFA